MPMLSLPAELTHTEARACLGALAQGLRWAGLVGPAADPVLGAGVVAIGMGAFVAHKAK